MLTPLDWSIVIGLLVVILGVGFWVSRQASESGSNFFLAGRHMPWWLLGTSMVATTFATDTPNLVTNIVRTNGVAGNWVWWCFLITGMATAFIYARLWRRLGVTTDIEFYERRYAGPAAAFLRGFRGLYLGVFFNIVIMANVTLAAIKIGGVLFEVSPEMTVLVAGLVTVLFAMAGGLLGVLITDLILFCVAMLGAFLAAYYSVTHPSVGGLKIMLAHPDVAGMLSFVPDLTNPDQFVPLLLIPLAVQWWSVWYPGSEPGGGGYVAQRMLSAKDEDHAVAAVTFFNFAHYAIRPWPWILVALASLIIFPDLGSLERALPHVDPAIIQHDLAYSAMLTFLPAGVLGIVVASLVAAYVSTMSTSLNWGASYVVNDFFVRFISPNASPRTQVLVGRLATLVLMGLACLFALVLESALQAFHLLLTIGAGTGLLFLVRWYWSRINAWSEISAMVFSLLIAIGFEFFGPDVLKDWQQFLLSVGLTTLGWVTVTLVTSPTPQDKLDAFHESLGEGLSKADFRRGIELTLWSCLGVYGLLFGTGYLLYGSYSLALVALAASVLGGFMTRKLYIKS